MSGSRLCESARSRVNLNPNEPAVERLGLDADGPRPAARVEHQIALFGALLDALPDELPRERCIRLIGNDACIRVGYIQWEIR